MPGIKHQFIGQNLDDEDSAFPGGTDYREMRNLIIGREGLSANGNRENILSTAQAGTPSLPTGTNRVIGSFEDRENNYIHYFIWNSTGQHQVQRYDPETNTYFIEAQNPELGFQEDSPITGISVLGRVLYWADNQSLRAINIDRDQINEDITLLALYKRTPPQPMWTRTGADAVDPSRTYNLINGKNFQFACRYVYKDNERSILSPFSSLSVGNQIVDPFNTDAVRIRVDAEVIFELRSEIQEVEFYARENNIGPMKLFEVVPYETSTSLTAYFYNDKFINTLSDAETEQVIEGIPRLANGLTLFKNRLVVLDSLSNYNPTTFGLSLTELSATGNEANNVFNDNVGYFKENASYEVGLIFRDNVGRPTAVRQAAKINMQRREAQVSGATVPSTAWINLNRGYINVALTGQPPEEAYSYQVAITENQSYIQYTQCVVDVNWFLGEDSENFTFNPADSFLVKLGPKAFTEKLPTQFDDYAKVALRVPYELPFTPDNTYFVRVMNLFDGEWLPAQRVLSYDGIFIYVNNFDIGRWDNKTSDPSFFPGTVSGGGSFIWVIEIFKPREEITQVFQEVGPVFDVTDPGTGSRAFSQTNISLEGYGDAYPIGRGRDQNVLEDPDTAFHYPALNFDGGPTVTHFTVKSSRVESPTNVYKEVDEESLITIIGNSYGNTLPGTSITQLQSAFLKFVHDYTKIAWSIGRAYAKLEREKETRERTSIRYSNPYVEESLINGLNSFEPQNKYVLPSERTKIRMLSQVGNIILAIHERETTSLYMSEGFLKTGNGEFLTETQDIFTDQGQRKLRGLHGTINPESFAEHDGTAFWFDAYMGEVVRYDNNGLTPLAEVNKMKTIFKKRGDQVREFGGKVIGGYDPFTDIYYLTFPAGGGLPATTYGFCNKPTVRRFIGEFDFIPEYYGKINEQLVSFVDGQMWLHNQGPDYGQFYGTYYPSKINQLINVEFSQPKIARSMSIESTSLWKVILTTPSGQETELDVNDFEIRDITANQNFYADFKRDKNSYVPDGKTPIIHGDDMRGKVFTLEMENSETTLVVIDHINFGYEVVYGHTLV